MACNSTTLCLLINTLLAVLLASRCCQRRWCEQAQLVGALTDSCSIHSGGRRSSNDCELGRYAHEVSSQTEKGYRGAPAGALQVCIHLMHKFACQHHEFVQPELVNPEPFPLHGPCKDLEVLQGALHIARRLASSCSYKSPRLCEDHMQSYRKSGSYDNSRIMDLGM